MIREIVGKINASYSKKHKDSENAVALLGESVFATPRNFISSGIHAIDCAVCYGKGFPPGIIEIYGGEATSKTALLENILAESQRRGYHAGIFPMEFSLDYRRSQIVGIDTRRLMVFEDAETIEDVYELLKIAVSKIRAEDKTDTPIVIGIDTLASTPTATELDDEKKGLAKSDMGKMAMQMSRLFKRLVKFLFKNNVCLICVNQTRTNLGVRYGDKETTPGGRALRFYAWVRCRMRRGKLILGKDDKSIGAMCNMYVIKNKVGPPFRECNFPVFWSRGIDAVLASWQYCVDHGIFKQKGTSYRYKGKVVTRRKFPKFYATHKKEIDRAMVKSTEIKAET
jgi:recombination protein RecA